MKKWVHYSIDDAHKILNANQVTHFFCHYDSGFKCPYRISFQLVTKAETRTLYYGNTAEDRNAAFAMLMKFLDGDESVLHLPEVFYVSANVQEVKRTLEVV